MSTKQFDKYPEQSAAQEQCSYCKQWFPKPVSYHHSESECHDAAPSASKLSPEDTYSNRCIHCGKEFIATGKRHITCSDCLKMASKPPLSASARKEINELLGDLKYAFEVQGSLTERTRDMIRQAGLTISTLMVTVDNQAFAALELEQDIEEWRKAFGAEFDRRRELEQYMKEQDAEIARLKSVPMKYRRMEFNAQLQNKLEKAEAALARSEAGEKLAKAMLKDALKLIETARAQAIEICDEEGNEWASDAVRLTKNYAHACRDRIRALTDKEPK